MLSRIIATVALAAVVSSLPAAVSSFACKIGYECASGEPDDNCKTSADCPSGLTCVIESQYYSQCVDCTPASFAKQCVYMSETFLPHAEDTCGIEKCGDRCPHHKDTECDDPAVCVVQADGYYAQCIDCTESTFDANCKDWSQQIRAAAEIKCKLTCPPSEE